jgi:hypothetical protein
MTYEEVRLLEQFVDVKLERQFITGYITHVGDITQADALKLIVPIEEKLERIRELLLTAGR